jgi:hypothetical protein
MDTLETYQYPPQPVKGQQGLHERSQNDAAALAFSRTFKGLVAEKEEALAKRDVK